MPRSAQVRGGKGAHGLCVGRAARGCMQGHGSSVAISAAALASLAAAPITGARGPAHGRPSATVVRIPALTACVFFWSALTPHAFVPWRCVVAMHAQPPPVRRNDRDRPPQLDGPGDSDNDINSDLDEDEGDEDEDDQVGNKILCVYEKVCRRGPLSLESSRAHADGVKTALRPGPTASQPLADVAAGRHRRGRRPRPSLPPRHGRPRL